MKSVSLVYVHDLSDLLRPQAKIQTIHGHARFTNDPEPTVEVHGKKYTAPHILIATGGQPSMLTEAEVPGKSDAEM